MISTVSLAAVLLRSTQNTCAPSRANVTAVALPLPQPGPIEPAPTTIAILPLSRSIDFSLFNVVEACSPDEANGSRECAPDDKLRAIRDSFHVENPGFRKCFILATDRTHSSHWQQRRCPHNLRPAKPAHQWPVLSG